MGYKDLALSYSNQKRVTEPPASGGGLSQNKKFSYGYASSAGKRSSMEDFFETRIDGIHGEIVGLFGVFDGHGGAKAAEYVKHHLFSNLITHPKFISDTKSAIADAYNHTDSELLKSDTRDAGSTASTAILVGDRLLVANVGDSRAVICRGGNAFAVSRDHKPDQSDERERIENAGGFVMWAGTWRVGGVLAVSRSFGDRMLKQYVVADPEIQEEKIDDSLEFLILASDGLWDVFSNEEAVAVVKEVEDPEESTKKLVGEAIRRGSGDNITCVVVRFLESKTGNNKASSSQEANQVQTAVRDDSDHKKLAKETDQDHSTLHKDLNRNTETKSLNQNKQIAARRDEKDHSNSTQKPIEITSAKHSVSSEQSGSASEPKSSAKVPDQEKIRVHNGLDHSLVNQKQVVAATHSTSLEQSSGLANRSEPKNSAKVPDQEKIRVHNGLDHSLVNLKQVAAATHSTSLEQSNGLASRSEPKNSAKVPDQEQIRVHHGLDHSIVNQKQVVAATHSTSLEQSSGATGQKNQKPIAVHSNSQPQSKASSVPSISN